MLPTRPSPLPLLNEAVIYDRRPSELAARLMQCMPVVEYGPLGTNPEAFRHRSRAGAIGDLRIMAGHSSPFGATIADHTGIATINFCLSGEGQVLTAGETFSLNFARQLVYIPGQPHRCAMGHYLGIVISLPERRLLHVAQAMAGGRALPQRARCELARPQCLANRTPRAASLLKTLRSCLELLSSARGLQSHDLRCLALDDHIVRLLVLLLCPSLQGEERTESLQDPAARRVLDHLLEWIRANLHHPLSLSALETRSGYSRRTLQVLFRQHLGCTPSEWVRQQRLEAVHSRLLCPQEGDTVGGIALDHGFTNASAFTREFRRRFGLLPSHVLRQSRCGAEPLVRGSGAPVSR